MQLEKRPPYFVARDRIKTLVPTSMLPPLRRLEKRARILRHRDWRVRFLDPERDSEAIRRRLLRLDEAAAKGVRWALGTLDAGSIATPEDLLSGCYKGVWALAAGGHEEHARTLLGRIAREASTDGDLPTTDANDWHYLYPHSYIAIGAHEVGERGPFGSISGFVAAWQDPRTGGFWSQPPGHPERSIESVSTSLGGLVLLRRGDLDSAQRAAEALERILRSQPAPTETFFTTMGGDGKLIADPSLLKGRAIHVGAPDQVWYALGLASLFLAELYERSGERAHLELAAAYMEYFRRCTAGDRFFLGDAGKTAATMAALYRLTRNKDYARIALSMSSFIAGRQLPNGRWAGWRPDPGNVVADVQRTFEYALWLRLVTGSFAEARDIT